MVKKDDYTRGKYVIIDEGNEEEQKDLINRYIKCRQKLIGRSLSESERQEFIKKINRKIKNGE